jgi:RNA ligase
MLFEDYIGIGPEEFKSRYLDTRLVNVSHHHEFPLSIYTYGRKAVHENVWDNVTSRCRGIIVNRETGEVVARPFEKFHNWGFDPTNSADVEIKQPPVVWEKMDGFMCTAYSWGGKNYIASKGSFHSIHAKWATAEYNRKIVEGGYSPEGGPIIQGWTFVFEGLHKDLRIVVDYGDKNELVLLACINNETGEEKDAPWLRIMAGYLKMRTPRQERMTMEQAHEQTMKEYSDEEGYVLTWYRPGQRPHRMKLKFIEYLRLHRMVTGVSPKRIWEALATNGVGLDEYLNQSTPWFAAFTKKWVKALRAEFARLEHQASTKYTAAHETVRIKVGQRPYANLGEERKAWALEFTRPENKEFSSILFGMLDNRDVPSLVWKQVKYMTAGINPMVDAHLT